MKRVGFIFGGRSGEHEVSLMSAAEVIRAAEKTDFDIVKIGIDKDGKWYLYEGGAEDIACGRWKTSARPLEISTLPTIIDFAFPVLHGPYGEDGTVQGLFEMLGIPYAGCGVLASALCMDKSCAKDIFIKVGLPTCRYKLVFREKLAGYDGAKAAEILESLGGAAFVKPSNMGSSVGISKAKNPAELLKALQVAAEYDRRIIVEEALDVRELETAVIGNSTAQVAEVGEIIAASEFYDYNSKYSDESGTKLMIPAKIPFEVREEIRDLAAKAYKSLDCAGFARVDFFIEKNTGKIYINEINTIPGFTRYSMFPMLWNEVGVDFKTLIEKIVELGYERYNDKNNR